MPWERDVDVRLLAQHLSDRRVADGNQRSWRGTRDGAGFVSDWLQALIIEGRGFCAGIGLLSAGEALPVAVITTLRPQLWVRVPTGTTIMPFYGGIQVEDTGATGAFEALIGYDATDVGNGTSDAADYGPVQLRSGAARRSACTVRQEATADVTADPDADLWRVWKAEDNAATPATAGPSNFDWKPWPALPVLVGPASLMMYLGSSAAPIVTAQFQWVEFETSEIV